jgi:hypothetical protein
MDSIVQFALVTTDRLAAHRDAPTKKLDRDQVLLDRTPESARSLGSGELGSAYRVSLDVATRRS